MALACAHVQQRSEEQHKPSQARPCSRELGCAPAPRATRPLSPPSKQQAVPQLSEPISPSLVTGSPFRSPWDREPASARPCSSTDGVCHRIQLLRRWRASDARCHLPPARRSQHLNNCAVTRWGFEWLGSVIDFAEVREIQHTLSAGSRRRKRFCTPLNGVHLLQQKHRTRRTTESRNHPGGESTLPRERVRLRGDAAHQLKQEASA